MNRCQTRQPDVSCENLIVDNYRKAREWKGYFLVQQKAAEQEITLFMWQA
jgi:hypothetical protein